MSSEQGAKKKAPASAKRKGGIKRSVTSKQPGVSSKGTRMRRAKSRPLTRPKSSKSSKRLISPNPRKRGTTQERKAPDPKPKPAPVNTDSLQPPSTEVEPVVPADEAKTPTPADLKVETTVEAADPGHRRNRSATTPTGRRTNIRNQSSRNILTASKKMKGVNLKNLTWERKNFAKDELRVMTEEAAEWVFQTLDKEWEAGTLVETFWSSMQTGVDLCLLVNKCAPPDTPVKCACNLKAKAESFHARDNLSNFIGAAKAIGVHSLSLFESDDVVYRKNDKGVVNTLLQLARVAAKNGSGVKPPLIIQYEMEIDEMMGGADDNADFEEDPDSAANNGDGDGDDTDGDANTADTAVEEEEQDMFAKCRWLPYVPAGDELDEALALAVNMHLIDVRIKRGKKKGEYLIGKPPKVFLRLIRHLLLVRVGGGWQGIVNFGMRKMEADKEADEKQHKKKNVFKENKSVFKDKYKNKDRKQLLHDAVDKLHKDNEQQGFQNAYETEKKA